MTTQPRHNLCPNPSFEYDTNGSAPALWVGNACTLAATNAYHQTGAQGLKVTGSANTSAQAYVQASASAGTTYTVSAQLNIPTALANGITLFIQFLNASHGSLSVSQSTALTSTSGWVAQSVTATAPANTAYVYVGWMTATLATGAVYYVDAVLLEAAASAGTYFDGDTAEDATYLYTWDGTPGQSASTASPAPQLTVFTNASPCPRVEVDVLSVPANAATITVWRNWNGQQVPVRGADGVAVVGAFLIVDYEVPLGIAVTYTCQTATASGALSQVFPVSASVTVTVAQAWLSDPLNPTSAVPVNLRQPGDTVLKLASLRSLTYSADSTVSPVVGASSPLGYATVRRLAAHVPLEVRTATASAATNLRNLLMQAYPLCVRIPVGSAPALGGLAYFGLGDIEEMLWPDGVNTTWTAPGDSVQSPLQGAAVNVRTWQTLQSEATSWSQVQTLYTSWLNELRGSN